MARLCSFFSRPFLYLFFVSLLFISTTHSFAFDHSYKNYQKVLDQFVVLKGSQSYVNYKALKNNSQDLNQALSSWEKVKNKDYSSWTTDQRLAFLINAYNGFTLKLIIDHYPVESIKDIGNFFSSPWKKEFFNLLGKKTHLDHIEHDLIRKNYKEPRIHFAVNCASMGCPSLAKNAYRANTLKKQLQEAAEIFIKNTERNRFDNKSKTAYLSKIFKWYGDDFKEMTGTGYKDFLKNFAPNFSPEKWQIEWLDYDWNLNDTASLGK